jgi:hypothetical protein
MANKFTDATDGARGIASRERLVLMYLAHRSDNDTGICWPSEKRIAKDYDLSERTVGRAIAELQKSRLIKIVGERSHPGKKPVNIYQINLNKLLKLAPVEEKAKLEYTLEDDFLSDINGIDREESHTGPNPGITVVDEGILDSKLGILDPEVRLEGAQTQYLNSPLNSTENSSPSPCTVVGEMVAKPSPTEKKQNQNQPPQVATKQDCQDIAEAWWALKNHADESLAGEAFEGLFKIASFTEVLNVLTWLPNSINWDTAVSPKGVLKDFAEFCSLFPKIRKSYLHYMDKTPEKYHHKYIWKRQKT